MLTNKNFVRAHFFSNEVLILKESKVIRLFKLMLVDDQEEYDSVFRPGSLKFVNYHSLNMSGFISYQPGQPFLRIAQGKFIHSFKFDK